MRLLLILFSIFGLSISSDGEVNFDDWSIDELALFPSVPIAAPWSEDEKCREDSRKLMINLKNKTFWAMQMWDASSKTEFGMLYGNVYQGGNFDECLTVREPIVSQFCGVTVRIEINGDYGDGDPYELDPKPTDSVWKKLKDSRIDQSKWPRDNATWGICVPASCSHKEIEKSIHRHLERINAKLNGSMKYVPRVAEEHCQTQETLKFSAGEIGFWSVTFLIALLVVVSSGYDFVHLLLGKDNQEEDEESKPTRLFTSFSLKRNVPRMFRSENQSDVQELRILYPAKYLTIVFIIVVHRIGLFFASPMVNYQTAEENLRSFHNLFMPHGDLLVDTFFFISGMLGGFALLSIYEKKFVNPALAIVGRFLRFAPLYYYMIWFHASGLYRLGTGPAWVAVKPEVEFCQKNWWTNLLFISNYVNVDQMCLIHSWFIPCDLHLFLLTIVLVIIIIKAENIGMGIIFTLTLIAAAIPGIFTYYFHLPPLNMYYHYNMGPDIRRGNHWKYLYVPTQARAAVYFIGFLGGYTYFKTKNIKKKFPWGWAVLGMIISFGLFFAPMAYGSLYYNPRKQYDVIEASLFASLRRIFWGLGSFLFVISYRFSDKIPFVTWAVNSNFFVPLSKITYSIYLVHFYMIVSNLASIRIPHYYRYYDLVSNVLMDILMSTFYGAFVYLTVELPFKVFFHELIFAKVVKKVQKKIEEKENRRTIQDVLAKQEPEMPQVVSVKL